MEHRGRMNREDRAKQFMPFRHEVTIREEGDKWIYLGNCIEREGAYKIPEYKPRRDF